MTKFSKNVSSVPAGASQNETSQAVFSLKTSGTVNVLAYAKRSDSAFLLNSLLDTLHKYGMRVRVMCYGEPIGKIELHDGMNISFYGKKDFSLFGSPRTAHLKEFMDTPSDIFIDMTSCDRPRIRKVRSRMKSILSIGINPVRGVDFDFCYTLPPGGEDVQDVFAPMMQYLGLINS